MTSLFIMSIWVYKISDFVAYRYEKSLKRTAVYMRKLQLNALSLHFCAEYVAIL